MENLTHDVLIVGGSYAGLSAGMSLGRALKNVLIIDSGAPCNASTPHSHNFLTQDGKTPAEIASIGKAQVLAYPTVTFLQDKVTGGFKKDGYFELLTEKGHAFTAKRLLFTSGIKDQLPAIPGFADCWGKSIIHCPYCHGYEVRKLPTAIMANGEKAFHLSQLLQNWTDQLTLLTNGKSTLTAEQLEKLAKDNIPVIEQEISAIQQQNGRLERVIFSDDASISVPVMYAGLPFVQSSDLPEKLGCALNPHGYLLVNERQETTVPGIYAAGDNSSPMRAVANAVASGSKAGAMINFDLVMG